MYLRVYRYIQYKSKQYTLEWHRVQGSCKMYPKSTCAILFFLCDFVAAVVILFILFITYRLHSGISHSFRIYGVVMEHKEPYYACLPTSISLIWRIHTFSHVYCTPIRKGLENFAQWSIQYAYVALRAVKLKQWICLSSDWAFHFIIMEYVYFTV